jgi:cytochrome c oxidase subunit 2
LAVAGERLYNQLGCNTCHDEGSLQRCPTLQGIAGTPRLLASGDTVIADDDYLRESILEPASKVTAGYEVIMPSYQGQLSEEAVLQLLAYIKSLGESEAADMSAAAPSSPGESPGGIGDIGGGR